MGKIVIIFTMFSGRVGLISMAMPEPGRQLKYDYDYPTGEVLIG
jgi:Trk-type K+ transport system membrane component